MNNRLESFIKEPLFQLNLIIWLTQSQDSKHSTIYPLFYESGISIYSLGLKLSLPLDIKLEIQEKIDVQDFVRPDLVLETKGERRFCVLECKASSFSPDSQGPSRQARTLLLISGFLLSEVMGLGKRGEDAGLLGYLIGSSENRNLMKGTIDHLKSEITDMTQLNSAEVECLGLKTCDNVLYLEYDDSFKSRYNLKKTSPSKILECDDYTDPRPLYIIPYDPNIQSKEELAYSTRILKERILGYIISLVGGSRVSCIIKD